MLLFLSQTLVKTKPAPQPTPEQPAPMAPLESYGSCAAHVELEHVRYLERDPKFKSAYRSR